jgi:hypothetical protein
VVDTDYRAWQLAVNGSLSARGRGCCRGYVNSWRDDRLRVSELVVTE